MSPPHPPGAGGDEGCLREAGGRLRQERLAAARGSVVLLVLPVFGLSEAREVFSSVSISGDCLLINAYPETTA